MTIHFINNPCVFLRCTEADNLEGDIGLHCVRLSNLILANMVTFLLLMAYYRPKALVVMEQPKSSWLFRQVRCLEVIWRLNMEKYLTYMGSWGGLLLKGTHLMSHGSEMHQEAEGEGCTTCRSNEQEESRCRKAQESLLGTHT